MVQHLDGSDSVEMLHEECESDLNAWSEKAAASVIRDEQKPFKRQIVWFNLIGFLVLHLACVHSFYLLFYHASFKTIVWTLLMGFCGTMGVQMGAHRLFSHKSFKAKAPLRLALVLLQTLAGQNCLWVWVRDHRQHHRHSDTDGDPHNASNGFFFSHIGWLMSRKHPQVIAKGRLVDMADMEADPFVMFQKKYYKTLYVLLSIGLPTVVPCLLWGETWLNSFMVAYLARTVVSLNLTWLVNSAAHKYGNKPYTKDIVPVECELISLFAFGEGWHNYHHTFPWDYKAAELGQRRNLTASLIEACARRGWAYDLRSASAESVASRLLKRGDGSHPLAIAHVVDSMLNRTRTRPHAAGKTADSATATAELRTSDRDHGI